ncbi:carbamate kinase [Candidatus Micrarchaeota archaeon]|nr:carbamate kinase [Candidatus Micrarchaeota archaeon]
MNEPKKIVIALGGNALQSGRGPATAEEQLRVVRETCEHIADLSCRGYEIAIVHGNGPQVGRILLSSETAKNVTPAMPFDVCGAMSQGYIGYHLQQSLKYALNMRNRSTPVVTVATQMIVDENDPAFNDPTKPIGPFYSEEDAKNISEEKGYVMIEDAGRGWRRVVASPMPRKIVEIDAVKRLWDSTIVITCGGGGVPVIEKNNGVLEGVDAVIDKDFAAELLESR